MAYVSATQPESFKNLLLRSLQLYRIALPHVFILALAVGVIVFSPRLIVLALGKNIFAGLPLGNPYQLGLLLIDIACLIFLTAMLWRIQCLTFSKHESLKDDMKIAMRKLPLIFGAVLLQALVLTIILVPTVFFYTYLQRHGLFYQKNALDIFAIALPFIFAITLYIYIFYLVYFYLPLILTENAGAVTAIKESAQLVWGRWLKVFVAQTIPWVCYVLVLMLIRDLTKIDIPILLSQVTNLAYFPTLLHLLIFTLFMPWSASMMLIQLRDLELRKNHEKST